MNKLCVTRNVFHAPSQYPVFHRQTIKARQGVGRNKKSITILGKIGVAHNLLVQEARRAVARADIYRISGLADVLQRVYDMKCEIKIGSKPSVIREPAGWRLPGIDAGKTYGNNIIQRISLPLKLYILKRECITNMFNVQSALDDGKRRKLACDLFGAAVWKRHKVVQRIREKDRERSARLYGNATLVGNNCVWKKEILFRASACGIIRRCDRFIRVVRFDRYHAFNSIFIRAGPRRKNEAVLAPFR